ncbi:MAG: hypothetical protein Q8M15_02045 [Bacteroidota bacterium]|nr:hypothetical protein [Bacteroidota bacterium]
MNKFNLLLIFSLIFNVNSNAQFQKETQLVGFDFDFGQSFNLTNNNESGLFLNPTLKYAYFLKKNIAVGINLDLEYSSAFNFNWAVGPNLIITIPFKGDAFFVESAYSLSSSSYKTNNKAKLIWAQRENRIELGPGYILMLSKATLIRISMPISFSWYNLNESAGMYPLNYKWVTGINASLKAGFYFLILPKNEKK